MKRAVITLLLLYSFLFISAQRITHTFREQSLAEVLETLNSEQTEYTISFIHNDLEHLRVSAKVNASSLPEAVQTICKGQPVRIKARDKQLFVQYKKKEDRNRQEKYILMGKVYDFKQHVDLPGATVQLLDKDSTVINQTEALVHWTSGDESGERAEYRFVVPKQETTYILRATYMGYKPAYMTVTLGNLKKRDFGRELPPILMREDLKVLKQVTVSATKVQFYWRGDTIVYNADAFVLAEGSMLDALIAQLPGVEIKENGDIYHNGKLVRNLMLNGKDFFRNDRKAMLDNLPAYTVKQVEVYYKLGERSEFLGYELPNDKEYVMDVKLKKEYSIGWVGNAEAGIGLADARYTGSNPYLGRLFAMRFTEHSRLAVYANANNLNDNRKPGKTDTWTPSNIKEGTRTEQLAGLDYNVDDRSRKWNVDGEAKFSHSLLADGRSTLRTNFLPTGNTVERIANNSHDGNLTFSTSHHLKYTFDLPRGVVSSVMLNVKPNVSYRRYDTSSAMTSEAYGDTLINRYTTAGLSQGEEWKTQASVSSVIQLRDNTSDAWEVYADVRYRSLRDDTFNRYALYMRDQANPSQTAEQYFRGHPDRNCSAVGNVTYNRLLSEGIHVSVMYSLKHATAERDNHLYRLDRLNGYEQGRLGWLPSVADYELGIDARNSYDSRSAHTEQSLTPDFYLWRETGVGRFWLQARFPVTLHRRTLDYRRGAIDTTLTKRDLQVGIYNTFLEWKSKNEKHEIQTQYGYNPSLTDLLYSVDMRDDTDPLNIREAGSNLRNSVRHWGYLYYNYSPKKGIRHSIGFNGEAMQDAVSMGYTYDTRTGVRTFRPYNVNGNWNISPLYFFNVTFENKNKLNVGTATYGNLAQNVDLIGAAGAQPAESRVLTRGFSEQLRIIYTFGQNSIRLNTNGDWRRITSPRTDFTNLSIWNYDYGIAGNFQPLASLQLSTDFTVYSRRGWSDPNANTDDLIWNARLTYTLMKGNLLLMLDGFDLLGRLSNITYTVNGQGRTEVRRNVLPRYTLFHIQYRFNKQPSKRR